MKKIRFFNHNYSLMRNILITGINGFVGLNIYNSLKNDYKLYGIGHGKRAISLRH